MRKQKAFLAPALLLAPLLLMMTSVLVGSPVVSVQTGALGAGQTFTASIAISGVTDLYAFQFDLSFSPAVIAATSISEGSFLPAGGGTFFIPGTINNAAGAITFTADSLLGSGGGVSGSGVLANVSFHGIGQGISPIALANVQLLDSHLSPIVFATTDGQSPQLTPEPAFSVLVLAGVILLGCLKRQA